MTLLVLPPSANPDYIASASSVESAENCLRIWAFDKLDKVPRESSESQDLGTRVHRVIEDHLRSGRTIPLPMNERAGQIAMAGAHLWPEDLSRVEIEMPLRFRIDDVDFVGYVDLLERDVDPAGTVVIRDHKTTSDFKWAKTRAELATNVQATLYQWAVEAPGASFLGPSKLSQLRGRPVDLEWIYYRTKGAPKALATWDVERDCRISLHLDEIRPRVEKTLETARLLRKLKMAPAGSISALDLPPTVSMCDRFNGCSHRHRCNLTPGQRIRSLMSNSNASAERTNTTGSMIEELKKRQAAKGANGVNPPANAPHAPATGSRGRPPADQECPAGMFWIWNAAEKIWAVAPEEFREKYDPDGSLAWVEPPVEAPKKASPPAFVPPTEKPAPAVVETPGDPADAAPAAETPKGPGRPKGSKNAPKADEAPRETSCDPTYDLKLAFAARAKHLVAGASASELKDIADALAQIETLA